MNKPIPAVGYIRCSTEQQEDSPEQQRKAILEFAERKGYTVSDWFIDFGKSGTTFEQRPEFVRLRQVVDGKPIFRAVICYDESRWGRAIDPEENVFWRVYFRQRGVDVVLVKTSIDPKNEFAPMLKSFEGIQASQYSKKLSELTLRGAMNNRQYSNGGTAPYGYKRVAVNLRDGSQRDLADAQWSVHKQEKVIWELGDLDEVETVKFIFKLRLQGKAYVLIAEALNIEGIPCPKRGRRRNKDQKWSGGTIKTMLENPVYYGARVYNRLSMSKIIAQQKGIPVNHLVAKPYFRNDREEWIFEENAHTSIVTKEVWEQVNAINRYESKKKANQHTLRSTYLLTGLMRCSKCGFAYQGRTSTRKGHHYSKYICGGYQSKRICDFCAFNASPLESYAIQAVEETLTETLLSGKVEKYVEQILDVNPLQQTAIRERLKAELEENDRQRKNLADAIAISSSSKAISLLVEKLELLEKEAEELRKQSQQGNQLDILTAEVEYSTDTVKKFIAGFANNIWNASEDVKKAMLRKCISEVIVDRDANKFRFEIRKVPAVTPELEKHFAIHKPLTISLANLVSATSSGGRQRIETGDIVLLSHE